MCQCLRRATFLLLCGLVLFGPSSIPARAAEQDSAVKPNLLSKEELDDGWIQLFDGETLFGWSAGSKADWKVADGVVSVTSGEPGLLHTTSEFGDFVLRVDFRAERNEQWHFLGTPAVPKSPTVDCYEANIAQPRVSPFPTGSSRGGAVAAGAGLLAFFLFSPERVGKLATALVTAGGGACWSWPPTTGRRSSRG